MNKLNIIWKKSPNYSKRHCDIKLIVIHWTACSYNGAINWLCNKGANASAHYVIDKMGQNITQLVKEKNKAWHAGRSYLDGYGSNLNESSIGIELEGPPSTINTDWWYADQVRTLAKLCNEIKERYPEIKICDHCSIAPTRKIDVRGNTGHTKDKFPWKMFLNETTVEEALASKKYNERK